MGRFTYTKQSCSRFIGIGTAQGGYICEWDPFVLKLKVERLRGIVQILVWQTSNLVIFLERVGDKRCYIWDSEKKKIWDVIQTERPIQQISCIADYLCISSMDGVDVYDLPSLKKNQTIKTITVPNCVKPNRTIHWVGVSARNRRMIQTTAGSHTPHQNEIAQICLDRRSGNQYATVSQKGTIVRVWDYGSNKLQWEGRRGLEPASAVDMDLYGNGLVLSTQKGSVHFFHLDSKSKRGFLWDELPKAKYTWRMGDSPMVQMNKENIFIADSSGVITIVSIDSGETLFQTSLMGDPNSPFVIPLS